MASPQLAEAAKHMAAAKKKGEKGIFNWNPDYDDAGDLYGKAATIYRANSLIEEARKAFELQAEMYEKAEHLGLAARALEAAGQMMIDQQKVTIGAPLLERAAKLYLRDNKTTMTSGVLQRAARALLDTEDPSQAMKAVEMVMSGITALENDGKHILTKDLYRMAVLALLRADKLADAIATLRRQIPGLIKSDLLDNVAKACLEIIIIHLQIGDGVMAGRALQELSATAQGFSSSDEYYKATELCSAFDDRDQERLAEVGKSQLLSFLIPEVSRFAKRLKVPGGAKRPAGAAVAAAVDDDEIDAR